MKNIVPNLPGRATHFRAGFGPTVACGAYANGVRFIRNVGRDVSCKSCLRTKIYKKAFSERIRKAGT